MTNGTNSEPPTRFAGAPLTLPPATRSSGRERTASQPFARDTVVGDHSGPGPAESPVPSRMAPIPVVAQQWDRPRADLGGRGHVHLEGRAPVLRVDVHDKGGNRFGARQGSQDGQSVRPDPDEQRAARIDASMGRVGACV